MMRIGHADFRIGSITLLPANHEGDDASQIGLICQHLQVIHQLRVLVKSRRDPEGALEHRNFARRLLFRELYAPLDISNSVKVLGKLDSVPWPQARFETRNLRSQRVE